MSGPHVYVAIDIGSTSIKAAIASGVDGRLLGTRRWPTPGPADNRPSGYHETRANSVVAAVRGSVQEILSEYPNVEAIGFSTQMQGVILTDGYNTPISPFISWQDDRLNERLPDGQTPIEEIKRTIPTEFFTRTGINPRAGLGGLNAKCWLVQNKSLAPCVRRVHTLGSFILSSLVGAYCTHMTNAAALALTDTRSGTWNSELIDRLGFDGIDFPEIRHDFTPIGTLVYKNRLISVYPDIGDHQASVHGSGRDETNSISISLGTAGIAARTLPHFAPSPRFEVRPYVDGRYLNTVSRLPGGRHVDICTALLGAVGRDVFGIETAWERVRKWSSETLRDNWSTRGAVRAFDDTRDGAVRLALSLPLGTNIDAADIWTAVLEHFSTRYREAAASLFDDALPARGTLNGGMALRMDWLPHFFAATLGVPFALVEDEDLALKGVIRLLRDSRSDTRVGGT